MGRDCVCREPALITAYWPKTADGIGWGPPLPRKAQKAAHGLVGPPSVVSSPSLALLLAAFFFLSHCSFVTVASLDLI